MRIRSKKDQKELLSGLGFTPYKAIKLVLFSMTFSALGLSAFVFYADYAHKSLAEECSEKLKSTFDNISSIYIPSEYQSDLVMMKASPVPFVKKKLGPADLNLDNKAELVSVKLQRKKISDSQYLIRIVAR